MSDSPPRDPKIADAAAPSADAANASGAAGANAGRAPLSSNLQYLMKQPSTPWMTFDRDSKAAAVESALDAAWGEEGAPEPAPPPRPLPPAPPMPLGEVKFLFDSSAPPADVKAPLGTASAPAEVKVPVDVPPPPAHLMAVVDQVLAQSRPPPADPGPANSPRTNLEWPVSALHSSSSVATSPVLDLAPRADVASPAHNVAPADVAASAPFAPAPAFEASGAPHGSLETSGELAPAKKSGALLYAALGGGALVVIGIAVVAFVALRSPSDKSASSAMTSATNNTALSVAIAPSASAPPDNVTLPVAPPTPKASASVAVAEDVPAVAASASSTPSTVPASTTASTPSPASPIDPKTGAKRASYLTIPRAASRHHIFLDGKLMLGSGARSFPVKCGEHTLAIDDRKATRTINVTCGGEYVVTN
jgi:hypothetical protein